MCLKYSQFISSPSPVSSPQPTRRSCGLPSPAPPSASLPPPSRASAAGAQGIRLSSPPRGVYLRQRRSRSWAGLAATSEQSPPAEAAQFAVCGGATPRAPEGRALTAEAGLMPGGAAASGRRLGCGERAATPRGHTPEASAERWASCLLPLPSLRASARRRDTRPADADRRHKMALGAWPSIPQALLRGRGGRALVEAVKGREPDSGVVC